MSKNNADLRIKLKGGLRLMLKLVYNLFRRPQAFFSYLSLQKIFVVFKFGLKKDFKAAEYRLNDLLSGLDDGAEIFSFTGGGKNLHIIAPGHCLFLAKLMGTELKKLGVSYNIRLISRGNLDIAEVQHEESYIIICPQLYSGLPKCFIAMQMEQTVSNRWLNSNYLSILLSAHAVLDYSLFNIEYFGNREAFDGKLLYYLPIDYLAGEAPDSSDNEKEIDVLFYGDDSAERRAEILKQLKPNFNIKIVNNLFGEDMLKLVRKSKIVLNLHYYEDALLETTRLYEVLSQNSSIVISERSADSFEDSRLEEIVDFVDIGDIEAIRTRIVHWLSHEEERIERLKANNEKLRNKKSDFSYFFMRALLANEIIDFETFYEHQKDYFGFEGERVCLGLIKSKDVREFFAESTLGFKYFPGLRHKEECEGEALSLKFLKRKAEEEGLARLIVCKEDVLSSPDFKAELDSLLSESPQKSTELISKNLGIRVFFFNTDKKSVSNSIA